MHPLPAVTDLQGNAEAQGDLKSIVLHKMSISAQKNTFPVALGVRITGVDDSTFSQTGEAYSAISLPSTDLHTSRILQEDDTALAYEASGQHKPFHSAFCLLPFSALFTVRSQVPGLHR